MNYAIAAAVVLVVAALAWTRGVRYGAHATSSAFDAQARDANGRLWVRLGEDMSRRLDEMRTGEQ